MRASKAPAFCLGLSLYWAWVYLSFNSLQISGETSTGDPFIPVLHVVSGFVGCLTFVACALLHRRIEAMLDSRRPALLALLWAASALTTAGTLLYSLPGTPEGRIAGVIGGVVSGLASPAIALAWGVACCRIDVRAATRTTALAFAVAGALYALVSALPQPYAGILVSFAPLVSILCLQFCWSPTGALAAALDCGGARGVSGGAPRSAAPDSGFASMLRSPGQQRVLLGILMTMFVCGGMRVYLMGLDAEVFANPLLMAVPIVAVSLLFLGYSSLLPRVSLNLGPLYRIAVPLFAIAFAAVAMFGTSNANVSFVIVTAGATLIDMLTWVLVIETARTTRFSALLVFSASRLAIHAGMAAGELVAMRLAPGSMAGFFLASAVILLVVVAVMFTDRDTTFLFEPPGAGELSVAEERGGEYDLGARVGRVAREYDLSPRETEVFALWARGFGSKAIEGKLEVSPATVKTHLRHIYEKCDVHNRAEILELIERA